MINPITRRPTEPEFPAQLTTEEIARFSDAELQDAQEWAHRKQREDEFRQLARRTIETVLARTKGKRDIEINLAMSENYRGATRRDREIWIEELRRIDAEMKAATK